MEARQRNQEVKKASRSMKVKAVKGCKNPLIKSIEKIKIAVPEGLPPLHTTAVAVGSCNSGKTNWIYNLVSTYQNFGSFTRIFMMSPTAAYNPTNVLKVREEDIYQGKQVLEHGVDCVSEIEEKIKKEAYDYEQYEEYRDAYNDWMEDMATIRQIALLERKLYAPPKFKPRPSVAIIMDDLSHTEVFSVSRSNSFINLLLRHRHCYNIGLSIFMAVQTFTTGIPKILRQNIMQFFLWKTHDSTQLKSIYQQVAQGCTEEEFYQAFEYATSEPHSFLTVDLNNKDGVVFRKNFDEAIVFT